MCWLSWLVLLVCGCSSNSSLCDTRGWGEGGGACGTYQQPIIIINNHYGQTDQCSDSEPDEAADTLSYEELEGLKDELQDIDQMLSDVEEELLDMEDDLTDNVNGVEPRVKRLVTGTNLCQI